MPPSHFISHYFLSSSPLRICPCFSTVLFLTLFLPTQSFFLLSFFFCTAHLFHSIPLLPLLLHCHFVWAPMLSYYSTLLPAYFLFLFLLLYFTPLLCLTPLSTLSRFPFHVFFLSSYMLLPCYSLTILASDSKSFY